MVSALCARPHLQQRARALALTAGCAGAGASPRLHLAALPVCRGHLRQDLPQGLQPRLLPLVRLITVARLSHACYLTHGPQRGNVHVLHAAWARLAPCKWTQLRSLRLQ